MGAATAVTGPVSSGIAPGQLMPTLRHSWLGGAGSHLDEVVVSTTAPVGRSTKGGTAASGASFPDPWSGRPGIAVPDAVDPEGTHRCARQGAAGGPHRVPVRTNRGATACLARGHAWRRSLRRDS